MPHTSHVAGGSAGALLAAYRPLLDGLAHRIAGYDSVALGAEDLAQTGAIELLAAAEQADPQAPGFPRYARLRVEGAMRDAVRRAVGRRGRTRPKSVPLDEAAIERLADPAFSPEEALEANALVAAVSDALAALPARQHIVLRLAFERGLSFREIADLLAISVSQVSRLHSNGLAALRDQLSSWHD